MRNKLGKAWKRACCLRIDLAAKVTIWARRSLVKIHISFSYTSQRFCICKHALPSVINWTHQRERDPSSARNLCCYFAYSGSAHKENSTQWFWLCKLRRLCRCIALQYRELLLRSLLVHMSRRPYLGCSRRHYRRPWTSVKYYGTRDHGDFHEGDWGLSKYTLYKLRNILQVLFIMQFFHHVAIFFVKLSLVLFYKTIFPTPKFTIAANTTIVVLVAWIVAFFFATLFQDHPISRNWGTNGTTIDYPLFYTIENCTDIFLDIWILCMPLPVIKNLHMNKKKKWLLGGIFSLGFL